MREGRAVATREYFPRERAGAVRQRTRWITGICLQSWEFHSLGETIRHLYWFWRDRKSVVGNIVGPLTNLFFVYGVVTLTWAVSARRTWELEHEISWFWWEAAAALGLQIFHTALRMGCCARVYGWRFALGVPVRVVAANWINCIACGRAISIYTAAKLRREPLRWVKTEHAYPNRAALMTNKKRLGEILVGGHWITEEQLVVALAMKPASRRLGEHLRAMGLITEVDLYTALALQNDLPIGKPEPSAVSIAVTRSLPAALAKKWCVLPFRIAAGELYLAGAEIPNEEIQREIRQFSSLGIRFQLVTPTDYEELAAQYLS
jgi:adsorption protein B